MLPLVRPARLGLIDRLDRLGRSLRALLDACDALDAAGVTIRSATEPFDTSSPFGKAMFHVLGVIAESECDDIPRTDRCRSGDILAYAADEAE